MTSLHLVSALVGLAVAFGYFWVFHKSVSWSVKSGHVGRFALVLAIGLRQLLLAGILAGLWMAGLPMEALVVGLVVGVLLVRIKLLRRLHVSRPNGR